MRNKHRERNRRSFTLSLPLHLVDTSGISNATYGCKRNPTSKQPEIQFQQGPKRRYRSRSTNQCTLKEMKATNEGGKGRVEATVNQEMVELNMLVERLSLIKTPEEVQRALRHSRGRDEILKLLLQEESLLKDRNKHTILEQAYNDDSSAVCTFCNALLPKTRMQVHLDHWCSAKPTKALEEDAMEE